MYNTKTFNLFIIFLIVISNAVFKKKNLKFILQKNNLSLE